jgi:NAD+ kinase
MMPIDLVLVRHGESEGNVVSELSKKGNHDAVARFKGQHGSRFRLTKKGVEQAKAAGEWIRENIVLADSDPRTSRYYVSSYARAMETAGHLGLPDAKWYVEMALREREWGDLDVMSYAERLERFQASLEMKKMVPIYWIPPNGESIIQMAESRIYRMLGTLARECSRKRVVIVCHGEVMWAFRLLLERMPDTHYNLLDASKDPKDRIHNCQILHYTRRNPEHGGYGDHFTHMRSVCPWDADRSSNEWFEIKRPSFTNSSLLKRAEGYERLIED